MHFIRAVGHVTEHTSKGNITTTTVIITKKINVIKKVAEKILKI